MAGRGSGSAGTRDAAGRPTADPRLQKIRRDVIIALCSDDELMEQLVLKGGNALDLIYGVGGRTSQDLDYSIPADFVDLARTRELLFRALRGQFARAHLVVFDERLEPRPPQGGEPHQSGYHADFKLATEDLWKAAGGDLARLRREAEVVGPGQVRRVEVQISKYEYCDGKKTADLDGFRLFVYTPAMIAIEKLRAICQQMDEYPKRAHATARARDFYDIHTAITQAGVDLASEENIVHLKAAFAAKEVPLPLLGRIDAYRERHRADWPAVENSVRGGVPHDYDFYFDFVLGEVRKLEALGVVDSP
jgi:hypothetical protein